MKAAKQEAASRLSGLQAGQAALEDSKAAASALRAENEALDARLASAKAALAAKSQAVSDLRKRVRILPWSWVHQSFLRCFFFCITVSKQH